MQVWSLGQKDPLEEEMATHSSSLAWKIPRNLAGYNPKGRKELDTAEWQSPEYTLCGWKMMYFRKGKKKKKQKKSLKLLSGFLSSLAITLQYISFSPMLFSILCLNPTVTDCFSLQIYSSVPVVSMRNLRLGTVAMVLATGFWKRMNPVEKHFRAQVPCDKSTYLVSQMRSTVRTLFFTHCKNWYPEPGAKIVKNGASLMVQWLRIHLTMLGTPVW